MDGPIIFTFSPFSEEFVDMAKVGDVDQVRANIMDQSDQTVYIAFCEAIQHSNIDTMKAMLASGKVEVDTKFARKYWEFSLLSTNFHDVAKVLATSTTLTKKDVIYMKTSFSHYMTDDKFETLMRIATKNILLIRMGLSAADAVRSALVLAGKVTDPLVTGIAP